MSNKTSVGWNKAMYEAERQSFEELAVLYARQELQMCRLIKQNCKLTRKLLKVKYKDNNGTDLADETSTDGKEVENVPVL